MSDPVELAEKKSGKSKNSIVSKKSKKSNATPQAASEKGEIKSHNSQVSQSKTNNNNNIINNTEENNQNIQPAQKEEIKPIEEVKEETQPDNTQPMMSVRAYLEQNVTAVVQEALLEVARKRPPNPLQFVGNYILERANGQ